MSHLKTLSRRPRVAQEGVTTPLESAIITVLSIVFGQWLNGSQVIQNCRLHAKRPKRPDCRAGSRALFTRWRRALVRPDPALQILFIGVRRGDIAILHDHDVVAMAGLQDFA